MYWTAPWMTSSLDWRQGSVKNAGVGVKAAIHVLFVSEVALGQNQPLVTDTQSGEGAHGGWFLPDGWPG